MTLHIGSVGSPIRANTMEPEVFRQLIAMAFWGSVSKGILGGIAMSGDFAVAQNGTPNMSVNVASGLGVVAGSNNAPVQGAYNVYNDATVNIAVPASNPSFPRIDLICITIQDAFYSGATNTAIIQDVAGVAASSPTIPAAPANSLVLAHIYVGAGVTSITNTFINGTSGTNNPDVVAYRAPMLFGNQFQSHVTQAGAQADSNGVAAVLSLDTIVYDPTGAFNTGTHIFTAPTSGIYEVVGGFSSANFNSGDRTLYIYINSTQWGKLGGETTTGSGGNAFPNGTRYVRLNQNDTMYFAYTTPGTTASAVGSGFAHIFRDAGW